MTFLRVLLPCLFRHQRAYNMTTRVRCLGQVLGHGLAWCKHQGPAAKAQILHKFCTATAWTLAACCPQSH